MERILRVNLIAPFLCCQKAGRWMIRNGGGKIINIASVAGMKGVEGGAAYSSSKAGVLSLTRSLAIEWAKYNINVNAIAPGFINTPMQLDVNEVGEDAIEKIKRSIPQRRFGEAKEVAKVALFLASRDVSYVTGVTMPVDGGYAS